MKHTYFFLLTGLVLLANDRTIQSQVIAKSQSSLPDSGKGLRTDVFILNTEEPNILSFYSKYDQNAFSKGIPLRKLEMSSNKLSAFMISHINPLRYSYYINNQLVTQFMDASPYNTPGSTFTNGAFLPISDINTIQVFKLNSDNTNQRAQLLSIKIEMSNSRFALEKKEKIASKLYTSELDLKDSLDDNDLLKTISESQKSAITKRYSDIQSQILPLENALAESADSFSAKISNYEEVISEMNINNRRQDILTQIATKFKADTLKLIADPILKEIELETGNEASYYTTMTSNLDSALFFFRLLSLDVMSPARTIILP